jgi:DNA-binding MarR family transcriptional regulator
VAVCEEEHFTRAAEYLGITQSGLSASIRTLERDLGTQLLLRTTRRVTPTPTGRLLLAEAQSILAADFDGSGVRAFTSPSTRITHSARTDSASLNAGESGSTEVI